jgi:ferredoxin
VGERVEVEIDRDRCMGSGNCVFLAPETFDLSEDGHAVVLDPGATDEARLRAAAEGCPVGAISLHKGGVVLVPGQTDLVPHETEG